MDATIIYNDGTQMTAEQNGNCYIMPQMPDFPADLSIVTVESDGAAQVFHNAFVVECATIDGRFWFTFAEKTETDLLRENVDEVNATASIAFVVMAESGTIDEVTASEHMGLFAPWEPGVAYIVGNLRTYGEKLYRCIQAHTSQADWTPDVAASLWAVAGDPADEWPEWSQPIGAHDAYMAGDKVTHGGKHWTSSVDNNVWEPGVYGWTEAE